MHELPRGVFSLLSQESSHQYQIKCSPLQILIAALLVRHPTMQTDCKKDLFAKKVEFATRNPQRFNFDIILISLACWEEAGGR